MTSAAESSPGSFVTTRWTRVLAARGESPEARTALGELCEIYYGPVVAFLRVRLGDEDRAREVAHEFFGRLLGRGGALAGADPRRGRFRSYLLGAVKHYLADAMDRGRAAKRGGGIEHVQVDGGTDTSPGWEIATPELAPGDMEFDRQWALTLLARSLRALELEQEGAERAAQFRELKPWLTGTTRAVGEAAQRLGMSEGAVKVAVHRLRRRFRDLVKAEIASTVQRPEDIQEEMRYLVAVLAGQAGAGG